MESLFYFAGPLNINRQTKKAKTVLGIELPLTGNEFDALDKLAAQEGKPIPFENLFCTQTGLEHVIKQVGEAGEG
jgi:DNA-binding response OmpR family regulator